MVTTVRNLPVFQTRGPFHQIVAGIQTGGMGFCGGFGGAFFGLDGPFVFLPTTGDRGDGVESSVWTNFTSISSRRVPIGPTGFTGLIGAFLCKSRGLDGIWSCPVSVDTWSS